MKKTLRRAIIGGAASVHVACLEDDLNRLERKVLEYRPRNPVAYAHVVGRNWAIDRKRRARVQAQRAAEALRKAELEREERERFARCREEFLTILKKIRPKLRGTQHRQMRILWMRVFQGLSDAETAKLFLGSNRDLRYQWKRRGKKLVLPHASKELTRLLSRRPT